MGSATDSICSPTMVVARTSSAPTLPARADTTSASAICSLHADSPNTNLNGMNLFTPQRADSCETTTAIEVLAKTTQSSSAAATKRPSHLTSHDEKTNAVMDQFPSQLVNVNFKNLPFLTMKNA